MWSEVTMRGIQSLINKFRYMRSSKALVSVMFVMAVMLTGVGVYQFNQTAADAASPCNAQTNNIVPSGTHSYGDVTRHYNANTCGDVKAIYDHYWIKPNLAAGDRVLNGTSNNRGEVVADGRVVARNAASIGRHKIHSSSQPISIAGQGYYQTSHVGGKAFADPNASLATIVVLDKAGNFKYAIIKACGNPIYATPVNPPKPPEPPKPVMIQVCELATKKIITIREDQFNPQIHSKNLEDCKEVVAEYKCTSIAVSKLSDNKFKFETGYSATNATFKSVSYTVTDANGASSTVAGSPNTAEYLASTPGKYSVQATVTFTVNGKDVTATSAACKKEFEIPTPPPEKLVVCDLTTKKVVTINKDEFDSSKHSTNLKDCEEKCPIPGKEHLPVNSAECEEPVTPTPPELPKTGAADLLGAGVGLAAMGLSAYYYAASRRLF